MRKGKKYRRDDFYCDKREEEGRVRNKNDVCGSAIMGECGSDRVGI